MSVTSLRRELRARAAAALGLLLLASGCHSDAPEEARAEAIRLPVGEVPGLGVAEHSVDTDHSVVGYRYPLLGEAHPLTMEVRTAMARRQTAFLEELTGRGRPELRQDAALLAASSDVVGVRLTAVSSAGIRDHEEATTLWYDAESGDVLPWTSLFRGEAAIERAHLVLADALLDDYGLSLEELPGIVGEVALRSARETASPEGAVAPGGVPAETAGSEGTDLLDPVRAAEAAQAWEGSPFEDLAFSTAGGLAVRLDPTQLPGTGRVSDVVLPLEAGAAEGILSALGFHARDAALEGPASGLSADGPVSEKDTLDCLRLKCVALTFDDGPGEHTEDLLDSLAAFDAKATFYVLGSLVGEFPETVARMDAEGHELGNHTWKHDDLSAMSAAGIEADLGRTNRAVREVIGSDPPTLRPPYGALNGTVREHAGLPILLWDVDTMDWRSRDTDEIVARALDKSTAGSVVLLHDIHEPSVRAVPPVLKELHRQGYHFVTVSEMFGDMLEPGDVFTDARPQ
ncbi:polysaccharide deacetylase family protein [Nocardiopsis sp. LOL_012]|uniref:polysaccharide deacetylase family protein n=1 Tax=Nocardiopsis sp. LOL_012 TaxID=3345409 RepID=UPI003A8498E8